MRAQDPALHQIRLPELNQLQLCKNALAASTIGQWHYCRCPKTCNTLPPCRLPAKVQIWMHDSVDEAAVGTCHACFELHVNPFT